MARTRSEHPRPGRAADRLVGPDATAWALYVWAAVCAGAVLGTVACAAGPW